MLAERRAAKPSATSSTARRGPARWLTGYWRLTLAAATILAFVILVGHYLLVTLPARERDRRLSANREADEQQAASLLTDGETLQACLAAADAAYAKSWDASCRALKRKASCALPSERAQPIETTRRLARENCVKEHARR
jgi:hypothetical protein